MKKLVFAAFAAMAMMVVGNTFAGVQQVGNKGISLRDTVVVEDTTVVPPTDTITTQPDTTTTQPSFR